MKRAESQISSKAISTTPSTRETHQPHIHSYHQYESLLNFITSFIKDLKFYLVELKQIVYQFVGINPSDLFNLPRYTQPNDCEVEFMLRSCRNSREDLIRIIAILRGCYNIHYDLANHEDFKVPQFPHFNLMFSNPEDVKHKNLKISETDTDANMGMLTFRQIIETKFESPRTKWPSFATIEENNIQMSHSQDNISFRSDRHDGRVTREETHYEKAYRLIKLIKEQIDGSDMNMADESATSRKEEKEMGISGLIISQPLGQ